MLALILALSLFLHIADPVNDGYGNSSLTPPSSIFYRSVNAIDITNFNLSNDSKLGFSISFSDLSNPNHLKNGFSLPIVEIYFDDNYKQAKSNSLLPGSGMKLSDADSWHYAFKLSGDFLRLYENSDVGIVDISKLQQINISTDGNTISVSTDLTKKRNLKAYVIAGNYSAFSATGWKEISKQPSPWSYSSTSQTRPVVDLIAENGDLQTQAINSGILPVVSSRAGSQKLWRTIMILGLLLALIGLVANILAGKRQPQTSESNKLADRARAATLISELNQLDSPEEDHEFFNKLDIDISEYEKTMVIEESSDLDIDIDLKQFGNIASDTHDDPNHSSEAEAEAEMPKQKELFARPDGVQASSNKKNKKINVHNFSEDGTEEENSSASSETNEVSSKEKDFKTEVKKSLRVVDTVAAENKTSAKVIFDEAKPQSKVQTEEEIVFSLGDSFWDDFDKTRNIWKK